MDTKAFLETVWPATGIYCIAVPWVPPGRAKPVYIHETAKTIDAALAIVNRRKNQENVFFAVHTLKLPRVWNEAKKNFKTEKAGAFEVRTQDNMSECKCLFLDLDVGETDDKTPRYPDRDTALTELDRFLLRTGLPQPMVVSSGSGAHVYWIMEEAIPSADWKFLATKFNHVVRREGLRADPARTMDQSSVLRVLNTYNYKRKPNRTPVKLLSHGAITPNQDLVDQIDRLVGRDEVIDKTPLRVKAVAKGLGDQGGVKFQGEPVTVMDLITACGQIAYFASVLGNVLEPYWFNALGAIYHAADGQEWYQHLSSGHKDYDPDGTTEKVRQYMRNADGPPLCSTLDQKCGNDICATCPVKSKGNSPFSIARALKRLAPAPPPAMMLAPEPEVDPPPAQQPTMIPAPPYPFSRVKAGIMMELAKAKGEPDEIIVLPYDMFPVELSTKTELERSRSAWIITLPRVGQRQISVSTASLGDDRQLQLQLMDEGVMVTPSQIGHVRNYMVAYIRELQKAQDSQRQHDHLGWTEHRSKFVTPRIVINADGTTKPTQLSQIASDVKRYLTQRGTLDKQIELMSFYNEPEYIKHQFLMLTMLGSPLLPLLNIHGAIVNASGETGSSKSTALFTGASFWGSPTQYPLSGTDNSATVVSTITRMVTLANYPFPVDEITRWPTEVAQNTALSISQPVPDRMRNRADGSPQPIRSEDKGLIMATSANSSLHSIINNANTAGVATAMRVFEMHFPKADRKNKHRADEFLRALELNHGHIGEAMMLHVVPNLDRVQARLIAVQKIVDRKFSFESSERFYSAVITVALVALELAIQLGILPFAMKPVMDFLEHEQVPLMRGVVVDESNAIDPITVLTNFMEFANGDMMKTRQEPGDPMPDIIQLPRGEMKAHYDLHRRFMWIRKDVFRDYCSRHGRSAGMVIRELQAKAVFGHQDVKRILGQGTEHAKGRTVCLAVNMDHPELSGIVPGVAAPAPGSNVVALKPNIQARAFGGKQHP
jgi:hypothetical protein